MTSFSSVTFILKCNEILFGCHLWWQTCGLTARTGQTSAQIPPDDRGRVEEARRAAVSRLDPLYDPWARSVYTHTHNDQSHAVSWCLTMAFTNCVLNIKVIIGETWLSYFSEPHILLFRRPLPKQWHSVTLVSSGTFPWFSVNTGELNHVSGLLWPWCSDRIKGLWEMYFQWKCKGS